MANNAPLQTIITPPSSRGALSKKRILLGLLFVAFLVAGIAIGLVLLKQEQDIRGRAAITDQGSANNLSGCSTLVIDPTAKANCSTFCNNDGCTLPGDMLTGRCEIRKFHSTDNNDPNVNDTQTGFTNSGGGNLGFNQSCGAEQIDVGCYTDELNNDGVYNDGFKTVAYSWRRYSESCGGEGDTTPPTQPPETLPQDTCPGGLVCVPPSYWQQGGDQDGQYDNCGEVGRVDAAGSGQACGGGGFCCGPLPVEGGSAPLPTEAPGAICGESCRADSDCRGATIEGVAVTCRSGQCVNLGCWEDGGKTVSGTRCDCILPNACGDKCGAGIGLCEPGFSCSYRSKNQCNPKNTGVCVPQGTDSSTGRGPMTGVPEYDGATFERTRCGAGTKDANNSYISHPSFPSHLFTDEEIQQYICNATAAVATDNPTSSPTTEPDVAGQCLNIQAFDTNWNRLNSDQVADLRPGDKVRFSVAGAANVGGFTKARFTINGVATETTNKKPGSEEFYVEYEIPDAATGLTVDGEVYHEILGWI